MWTTDLGGEGRGMGTGGETIVFNLIFLMYVGKIRRDGESRSQQPSTSLSWDGNSHPLSGQGPQRGACPEGAAKVVAIVLRHCWFSCSKDEIFPGALADSPPCSLNPVVHVYLAVSSGVLLLLRSRDAQCNTSSFPGMLVFVTHFIYENICLYTFTYLSCISHDIRTDIQIYMTKSNIHFW